jgi:hypothetical protein
MAFATFTYTVVPITVMGNKRVHRVRCVVSAYQTEGIQLSAAICGLSIIDAVTGVVFRTVVANGPVVGIWDDTNLVVICHKASNTNCDAATAFNVDILVMGS